MKKIISQGAEATIYLDQKKIIKDRIEKKYRIKELDEKIRKSRTKKEAKLLVKAKEKRINVPKLLKQNKFSLEIEYLEGIKLSEKLDYFQKNKSKKIMTSLGKEIAKLHDEDIIHGDLTTSNVIILEDKPYVIDFGLGFISKRIEDRAVDLHLIKQALEAKHWKNYEDHFSSFLEGYKFSKDFQKTLEQLKKVESRGRYKH